MKEGASLCQLVGVIGCGVTSFMDSRKVVAYSFHASFGVMKQVDEDFQPHLLVSFCIVKQFSATNGWLPFGFLYHLD